jgi:Rrf2 family transcriptional regulator, cysteine metabolism repressor
VITISEKSRSAVIALAELAQRGSAAPVPILEIAESRGIPLHFLEQLFAGLRRAGILQSQRGVKGGYSFRRPAAEITVLEVVDVVDGRLTPGEAESAPVGAETVWADAREALCAVLGAVTIAEIVVREAQASSAPMFFI